MMSATMGSVESNTQRHALPPISHLDLDTTKSERPDKSNFPAMNGLIISTAPLVSPSTVYSGPPPPYSYAPSSVTSGYISPPESTTRRSTRDEKDSPVRKSLPSIHEALGEKSLSFTTPLSATASHAPGSTPSTAVTQSFPEAPKGPSNPFSQSAPSFRENFFSNQPVPPPPPPESQQTKPNFPPISISESRPPISQSFAQHSSPRSGETPSFRAPIPEPESSVPRSPIHQEQPHQSYSFPPLSNPPPSGYTSEPFRFGGESKYVEQRHSLSKGPDMSYGDTIKRHLDVFDAELGLNEILESSARTHEFSRVWAQRYHQSNRSGYYQDSLPSVHEIEDMLQQSSRITDNLRRMREVMVAQQHALSEHRARMARGNQMEDEYNGVPDEYKGGGFAGGDAKKRRGQKAAPPGRCHSCNRAETPEWRRGPDGARTLCNACGLHYAKLTRKMGVNKATALTGSNLRPKNLDQRP